MSNTILTFLSRSGSGGKQWISFYDITQHRGGNIPGVGVPSGEVRKFCRTHGLGFDTNVSGFWTVTGLYANNTAQQMQFKLLFSVTIPLKHEYDAMFAAHAEANAEAARRRNETERQWLADEHDFRKAAY